MFGKSNTFTTKKRPRKAWEDQEERESAAPSKAFVALQRELEEREKVEQKNAVRMARLDAMLARTEGRSETVGQLLFLDIELRKRMTAMSTLQSFVTTGRLIFEVFDDILPRTAAAMVRLVKATAEDSRAQGRDAISPSSYFNATFSYVEPGVLCRGGTGIARENASTRSMFPGTGEAMWNALRLTSRGVIALASEDSNEFIISFKQLEALDGQRMVFGRVLPVSFDLLDEIESAGSTDGAPTKAIVITGGGVVDKGEPLSKYVRPLVRPKETKVTERRAKGFTEYRRFDFT